MQLVTKGASAFFLFLLGCCLTSTTQAWFEVTEEFLAPDEIERFRKIEANEPGGYDSRMHGRMLLEDHFIRRLEESGAISPGLAPKTITKAVLTQSSIPHKDQASASEGSVYQIGAEGNVVLIFLNDNPKAKFVVGGESIPIVAGNMVTFNGHQTTHNTAIDKGEVHILGPFENRRLDPVTVIVGPSGDPHFKTWVGEKFDFHGQCDLELVSDPTFLGLGLMIHIRTKIYRNWSYIHSAVIQLGKDILEVRGGADEQAYWINGDYQGKLIEVGGFPVKYKKANSKSHSYTIKLGKHNDNGGDDDIEIRTYREFIRINLKPNVLLYSNTVGLLGNFETGKKLARNGVTEIEDSNEFGQEWQVRYDQPALFHEVEDPQAPLQKCIMPDQLSREERRRLGSGKVTKAMAEAACNKVGVLEDDLDFCVFDILAVDDTDMAGSY